MDTPIVLAPCLLPVLQFSSVFSTIWDTDLIQAKKFD